MINVEFKKFETSGLVSFNIEWEITGIVMNNIAKELKQCLENKENFKIKTISNKIIEWKKHNAWKYIITDNYTKKMIIYEI